MSEYIAGTPVRPGSSYGSNADSGNPSPSFGGTMRGSNSRNSITTSMLSFWDANQNGMKFNVSALDSSLSIAFWIPHVGTDGRRTYPKEQRYSTILSPKNCIALEDMLVNHLLEDYNASRNGRYSIFTNAARSTLLEFEVIDGEFYSTLYIGCDATTKVAQSTIRFKFEVVVFNEDYDPTTGNFNPVPVQADFFLFLKTVQGFNRMASGFIAGHGTRVTGNVDSVRLMNYIHAIANAVHAQLPNPNFQPMGTIRQIPGEASPTAPTPTMTEVDNLNDLIG